MGSREQKCGIDVVIEQLQKKINPDRDEYWGQDQNAKRRVGHVCPAVERYDRHDQTECLQS